MYERIAEKYNASPATITRDAKFAEAIDSMAAIVGKDAQSNFFDANLIGAAGFNWRGDGGMAGRCTSTASRQ